MDINKLVEYTAKGVISVKNPTKHKIQEAQYFLSMMKLAFEDDNTFSYNLSAFLSAARSITWYIQKQYRHKDGFEPWYDSKQKEMKADRELNYLNVARVEAVKKKSVWTGATRTKTFTVDALIGKKGTGGKGISKQDEPKPAAQSEPRTIGRFFQEFEGVEIVPYCESQLAKLTKIVEEGESRFL